MFARVFTLLILALVATAPLSAQDRKPKIQWERLEADGTVAGYRGGALLMTLKGEPWIGAVGPATKISITGLANRDVLRPGVVVRLSGEFDRKTGEAVKPITDMAIVTPRPGERPGVFPDEVIDPTERKKGPPLPTVKLRIFDAISGIKDNVLVFKRYRAELAPDATIAVDLADPSVLSVGDTIKNVKGRRIKGTRGRLLVEEIEAVLAQPLAAKKQPTRSAAKRNSADTGSASKKSAEKSDIFDIAGEEARGSNPNGKEASGKKTGDRGKRKETKPSAGTR